MNNPKNPLDILMTFNNKTLNEFNYDENVIICCYLAQFSVSFRIYIQIKWTKPT